MSSHNINSGAFNARHYFKTFIKDKSVDEVVKHNNQLFSGKQLEFLKMIVLLVRDQDSG